VVEAVAKSNLDTLETLVDNFRDKWVQVHAGLTVLPTVEAVDHQTQELLSRVQRKFPTDRLIEVLEKRNSDDAWFDQVSDNEVRDLGHQLLYSWISHYEYVRSIFKVNTVILTTTIPPTLRLFIDEARNCFAFEQHNAVISLCRTILEAATKDLCERKGFFEKAGEKIVEINPKVFNQLIKAVASGSLKRRAVKLYFRDACPVVHGDRLVDGAEALRVLRETTGVVQELYSSFKA
jgi:hypothetical protein